MGLVCATTREQARTIFNYIRAPFFDAPALSRAPGTALSPAQGWV
jgi:hypothetical protein